MYAEKRASKRTKHIEVTVSRENGLGGVHGLRAVWIGKSRPSLVGTLLSWFPAVATSPSVLSRFSGLIVYGLVHSLGNDILVDQKTFCSFVSFPASVSLGG